jgi:hypothetical protein
MRAIKVEAGRINPQLPNTEFAHGLDTLLIRYLLSVVFILYQRNVEEKSVTKTTLLVIITTRHTHNVCKVPSIFDTSEMDSVHILFLCVLYI